MTDATCYETFMHFPTDIKLMRGRTYHTHNQHIKLRTATRLEGSFGTQKRHYSLLKVRARTQAIGLMKSEHHKIEELFLVLLPDCYVYRVEFKLKTENKLLLSAKTIKV